MKENVMWFTTLRDGCTPTFCNSIKEKVISTAKGIITSIQKHKTLFGKLKFQRLFSRGLDPLAFGKRSLLERERERKSTAMVLHDFA
jgi:hypothetical protein